MQQSSEPVAATYRAVGTAESAAEFLDYATNIKQYNHFKVSQGARGTPQSNKGAVGCCDWVSSHHTCLARPSSPDGPDPPRAPVPTPLCPAPIAPRLGMCP